MIATLIVVVTEYRVLHARKEEVSTDLRFSELASDLVRTVTVIEALFR
jgi:hypothetical protein